MTQKNEEVYQSTHYFNRQKHTVEGILSKKVYASEESESYILIVDKIDNISTIHRQRFLLLVDLGKNNRATSGMKIRYTGIIQAIIKGRELKGFSRFAWKEGVYGRSKVSSFEILKRPGESFLGAIRNSSENIIYKVFPQENAALLLGISIGSIDLMTRTMKNDFLHSGMTHILIVSGSNIGSVIFLGLVLMRYMALRKNTKILLICLLLIFYSLIVGFEIPVLRALLMGIIGYISLEYEKKVSSVAVLLLIACILSGFSPLIILYDPGFGLSFMATMGILLFEKPIRNYIESFKLPEVINEGVSISLSATIGSLPVTIYHFGVFSPLGIIANTIISPILGPLLFLSGFLIVFQFLGTGFLYYFGMVCYTFSQGVLLVAHFFAQSPSISIGEEQRGYISLCILGIIIYFLLEREYFLLVHAEKRVGVELFNRSK